MKILLFVALSLSVSVAASAQTPRNPRTPPKAPPAKTQGKGPWRIEFHGGYGMAGSTATESTALPATGTPYFDAAHSGLTRPVSSWMVGDGPVLFNQVAAAHGFQGRITSLDSVLNSASVRAQRFPLFGVSLHTPITTRVELRFSLDVQRTHLAWTDAARQGVNDTAHSMVTGFTPMLTLDPAVQQSQANATAFFRNENGMSLAIGGEAVVNLSRRSKLIPYVAGGVMYVHRPANAPSFSIDADYAVTLGNGAQLDQHDHAGAVYQVDYPTVIGRAGGGVRYAFTRRSGLTFDWRLLGGRSREILTLTTGSQNSATPSTVLVDIQGSPSLQVSNQAQTPSSLSGPRLVNFQTFAGRGSQWHSVIFVGVYFAIE